MITELMANKLDAGCLPLKLEAGRLLLVDQRLLPESLQYFDATAFEQSCFAIKEMVVRGAPSIGVAAAFAFALEAARLVLGDRYAPELSVLAVLSIIDQHGLAGIVGEDSPGLLAGLEKTKALLDSTRPTAVNLRWGTDRMLAHCLQLLQSKSTVREFVRSAIDQVTLILDEQVKTNLDLSNHGASIVPPNAQVITHCNAGPLAVCGWGTALGVIRSAHMRGLNPHVYADETRPRNQGSKLTVWELMQDKIPVTLVCDNMSGFLMANKKIDLILVGADRIARNGDMANKIGTYNLAIIANYHKVPFYVAAPLSTFDSTISSGTYIPIEERCKEEVTRINGALIAPAGATALNPAFDVTPAFLINGIITEVGILRPPYDTSITQALGKPA